MPMLNKFIFILSVAFFAFILWMIYLANTGGQSFFFDMVNTIPYGDKVGHLCLFGGLTFVTIIASNFRHFTLGNITIYYAAAAVMSFSLVEEISQLFIQSRTFDGMDLLADVIGITIASVLAAFVHKWIRKRMSAKHHVKKQR